MITASEVLSSTLVQELRAQEAQAISRMSALSVEYGPKHPRMLQVNAELKDIRERIGAEVNRIVLALEQEASFAQTRISSIQTNLAVLQGATSQQNQEDDT